MERGTQIVPNFDRVPRGPTPTFNIRGAAWRARMANSSQYKGRGKLCVLRVRLMRPLARWARPAKLSASVKTGGQEIRARVCSHALTSMNALGLLQARAKGRLSSCRTIAPATHTATTPRAVTSAFASLATTTAQSPPGRSTVLLSRVVTGT